MYWLWESLIKNPLILLGPLVTAAGYFIFQYWRQRKGISCKTGYDKLVFIRHKYRDRVQISFDGKPIDDADVILIEIANSGWQPIEEKDFSRPITISSSQDTKILACEVSSCNPKNLGPEIEESSGVITIKPLLLNKGDSFELKALVEGKRNDLTVDARIKGISAIKQVEDTSKSSEEARRYYQFRMIMVSTFIIILTGGLTVLFTSRDAGKIRIVDADTSLPIVGAKIELVQENKAAWTTYTASTGEIHSDFLPPSATFFISREGYLPEKVPVSGRAFFRKTDIKLRKAPPISLPER